jgi:hypothetical protein
MDVTNVRVSDGWNSRRFLLYGTRVNNSDTDLVLVHVNFDDAFSGKCIYPDDYTNWSPTDEHTYCVLGAKTNYMRRKLGEDCYFGEDHEHITTEHNCTCTEYDYECDHCFYRPDLSSPCTLECKVPGLPEEPDFCLNSTESSLYYYSDYGYRLIPSDTCINLTTETKPRGRIPCKFDDEQPQPSPNDNGLILEEETILVTLLSIVACTAFLSLSFGLLWKTHPGFRNFCKTTFGIQTSRSYDSVSMHDDSNENPDTE